MDKDLIRKLTDEQPLTAEESLRLDAALESADSVRFAQSVSRLADETPSLAWRSALNESLSKVSRRRRTGLVLRYGFGATAVAAASFLVVSFIQPFRAEDGGKAPAVVDNRSESSLEDEIVAGHHDAMSRASLGVAVSFNESGS